jgi:hypothetical protein
LARPNVVVVTGCSHTKIERMNLHLQDPPYDYCLYRDHTGSSPCCCTPAPLAPALRQLPCSLCLLLGGTQPVAHSDSAHADTVTKQLFGLVTSLGVIVLRTAASWEQVGRSPAHSTMRSWSPLTYCCPGRLAMLLVATAGGQESVPAACQDKQIPGRDDAEQVVCMLLHAHNAAWLISARHSLSCDLIPEADRLVDAWSRTARLVGQQSSGWQARTRTGRQAGGRAIFALAPARS